MTGGGVAAPSADTRERLFAAAEELFAERGYAATSLRDLTERAGVNLAAANYHFRSKRGLIEALLDRHIRPINEQRLALLESALQDCPSIEAILQAFIAPVLQLGSGPGAQGRVIARLIGRLHQEPADVVAAPVRGAFAEVAERFIAALSLMLPEVSPDELMWRLRCVVGMISYTLTETGLGGVIGADDPDVTAKRLVALLAPGMQGPPTGGWM